MQHLKESVLFFSPLFTLRMLSECWVLFFTGTSLRTGMGISCSISVEANWLSLHRGVNHMNLKAALGKLIGTVVDRRSTVGRNTGIP